MLARHIAIIHAPNHQLLLEIGEAPAAILSLHKLPIILNCVVN